METPALPSQPASERELERLVPGYILMRLFPEARAIHITPQTRQATRRRGEERKGPSVHKGHPPCTVRSSPGQNLPAAEYLEAGDPAWGPTQPGDHPSRRLCVFKAISGTQRSELVLSLARHCFPLTLSRMGAEWWPKPLSFPNSLHLADLRQLLCQSHCPPTSPDWSWHLTPAPHAYLTNKCSVFP